MAVIVIPNSALVDCLSWLKMKVGLYAFIFRSTILTSPIKGYFFLLLRSSIYCWCTSLYSTSIFRFLLNSHTELKAIFTFHARLLFGISFVILGLPQIPLVFPSRTWLALCCEHHPDTSLTIVGVTQIYLGHKLKTCCSDGVACQMLNICWKKLLICAHI